MLADRSMYSKNAPLYENTMTSSSLRARAMTSACSGKAVQVSAHFPSMSRSTWRSSAAAWPFSRPNVHTLPYVPRSPTRRDSASWSRLRPTCRTDWHTPSASASARERESSPATRPNERAKSEKDSLSSAKSAKPASRAKRETDPTPTCANVASSFTDRSGASPACESRQRAICELVESGASVESIDRRATVSLS